MQVNGISSGLSTSSTGKTPGQLGKEDFLLLLLTQLKNQDPMNPMDDTQFIAQMAQFTALERMQQLDERMAMLLQVEQLGQASNLVGKAVEARDPRSGDTVRGDVDSARIVDGVAYLMIGDKTVGLTDVVSVREGEGSKE